jgi:hypothetical protein
MEHIQEVIETEEVGRVMEGNVRAEDYTFFYGEKNNLLGTGFVYTSENSISS